MGKKQVKLTLSIPIGYAPEGKAKIIRWREAAKKATHTQDNRVLNIWIREVLDREADKLLAAS